MTQSLVRRPVLSLLVSFESPESGAINQPFVIDHNAANLLPQVTEIFEDLGNAALGIEKVALPGVGAAAVATIAAPNRFIFGAKKIIIVQTR